MKRLVCESSNRENICGNKFDFSWKRNTWKSTFRFCKRRWKLFSTLTKFPSYRTSFRTRNFRNLGLFRDYSFPQISIAITTPSDSMAPLKICLDNIQIVGKITRINEVNFTIAINVSRIEKPGSTQWVFWWLQRLMPRQDTVSPIQWRLLSFEICLKFTFQICPRRSLTTIIGTSFWFDQKVNIYKYSTVRRYTFEEKKIVFHCLWTNIK